MNQLFKRMICCFITLTIIFSMFISASAKPFTDVNQSTIPQSYQTFLDSINYVSDREIMNGTSSTSFSPNSTVTRAMVVTTLYRISGEHETNSNNPFDDVPATAYYYEAVLWAKHHEIAEGVTPNHFNPNGIVTREQCLTFMYRYAKYKDLPILIQRI